MALEIVSLLSFFALGWAGGWVQGATSVYKRWEADREAQRQKRLAEEKAAEEEKARLHKVVAFTPRRRER